MGVVSHWCNSESALRVQAGTLISFTAVHTESGPFQHRMCFDPDGQVFCCPDFFFLSIIGFFFEYSVT